MQSELSSGREGVGSSPRPLKGKSKQSRMLHWRKERTPKNQEKVTKRKNEFSKATPIRLNYYCSDCRLSSRRTNLKHDYVAWSLNGRSRSVSPQPEGRQKKQRSGWYHHATDSRPETSAHFASRMSRGLRVDRGERTDVARGEGRTP